MHIDAASALMTLVLTTAAAAPILGWLTRIPSLPGDYKRSRRLA
jgi:hypothetical protein